MQFMITIKNHSTLEPSIAEEPVRILTISEEKQVFCAWELTDYLEGVTPHN